MGQQYPMKWDLDVFYEGGAESPAFAAELRGIERDIESLAGELRAAGGAAGAGADGMVRPFAESSVGSGGTERPLAGSPGDRASAGSGGAEQVPGANGAGSASFEDGPPADRIAVWSDAIQSILLRLRQSESFVSCLMAQQVKDAAAIALNDRVKTAASKFNAALTDFDERLRVIGDAQWSALLKRTELEPFAFTLEERRSLAKDKLPPSLEALAGELAVDGYHGWGDFYNTIVSRARFAAVEPDGSVKTLSAGQMHNRLSGADRDLRVASFAEWEREWGEQAELCAETLNRLAGFRLKLYDKRGWSSVLKEPLSMNRMSDATLAAMWAAVDEGKPALVRYLRRKAELLGVPKLDWHDVEAPIGSAGRTVPYDEAAAFIVDRFREFSPDMADFSEMAFRDGWIEAEDRPGKRPGGFCTAFPKTGQTRIFMTYSGTASNVSTLAHELGHAYHQHVMDDLPPFAQEYAMNVAETASTFAELIVGDSALQAAADPGEKLALLEDKLQRSTAFFMNIHARFLFETRFYEQRREGMLDGGRLGELMEAAQREAFCGALGQAHPHFWASKLHFYLTDVPFYNFPYTFGYLFSSGIYAVARREGAAFAGRYVELLRDTGRMTVEELARKHLGARLDEPDFWRDAVALTSADVDAFLRLTEK